MYYFTIQYVQQYVLFVQFKATAGNAVNALYPIKAKPFVNNMVT